MSIKCVFQSLFRSFPCKIRSAAQKAKKPPFLFRPKLAGFTMAGRKVAQCKISRKIAAAAAGLAGTAAATKSDLDPFPLTGSCSVEKSRTTLKIPASSLKTDPSVEIEIYTPSKMDKNRPCIVFSHGWETRPEAYEPLLKELASHGYVIINVGHPSSSEPYPYPIASEKEFFEERTSIQAANLRFVIDRIRSGEFASLGVSGKIVLAGHSMGGAASVLASREDPEIAGCINLDGGLKGGLDVRTKGLNMPFLMLLADHLKDEPTIPPEEQKEFQNWKTKEYQPMVEDWEALVRNSPHSQKIKIAAVGHMDFVLGRSLKAHQGASGAILKFLKS